MTRLQQAVLVRNALFVFAIAGCGDNPAVQPTEATDKVARASAAENAVAAGAEFAKSAAKQVAEPATVNPVAKTPPVSNAPNADEPAAPNPVDPEILAAIEAARAEELGVYVRFEDRDEKEIVALISAGVTKEPRTNWTKEVKLAEGRGIPLQAAKSMLKFVAPPAHRRAIADEVEERDGWRLRQLKLLNRENKPTTARKHLWSPDGRRLYLVAEGVGLTVIDAERWETLFEPHPEGERTGHIAWSAAGLIVLHVGGGRDLSVGTPWFELEGKEPAHLSVLDPVTLEVRKCWEVGGLRVAAHPESPIVYVSQWTDQYCRLLVIDAKRGELLNMIEGGTLRPKEELLTTVVPSEFFNKPPEGVVVDGPAISPDGKWLLNVPEPYVYESMARRSLLCRLEIDGPRLRCQQRLGIGPAKARLTKLSPDGRFVCICDPSGSGYGLLELTDFSQYLGAMAWEKYGGPFAVDSDSKTIYVAAWSGDFGQQVVLKAVQNGESSIIPLDTKTDPLMEFPLSREEAIIDLDVRPKHPGLLVLGKAGNYWIEGGKPADKWPFERIVTPESKPPNSTLKSEVPAKPLEPDPSWSRSPRVKLKADWLQWTPDGTAFLVASGETFHRFDGATHRETHRLHFGQFRRVIATSAALAVSDATDKTVTLIRYETLEPIRQLAPLERFSGNAAHPRIVGYNHGAIVMFDVATQKVVAKVLQEQLNHRWPRDRRTDRAILASLVDGERVFLHRDRLAILRVRDDQLEIERIWDGPSLEYNEKYSLSPAGNMCRYGPGIRSLDEDFKYLANSDYFVHFGDNGKAYFYGLNSATVMDESGQTVGIATTSTQMSMVIPHPTDKNRLLTCDRQHVYDEPAVWRDRPEPIVPPRERGVREIQREAQLTKNLQKLAASYVTFAKKNGRPPLKWDDIDDRDARTLELNYDVFFNMMPQEMTIGLEDVILAYPRNASTNGGLVVAADGTTRNVTADVFNKLFEEQLADLANTPSIRKTLTERTKQAAKAKANQPLREMLAVFRDAYFSFSDRSSGHGPPSWQEFEERVDTSKGLKDKFATLGYEMVFNLGPGDLPRGIDSFKCIIAYPKNGPQQGGIVVLHDGAIKELTAKEFNETAAKQAKLLKTRP